MKKSIAAIAVALIVGSGAAVGQVTSVQANLFTGTSDTDFSGGVLTVSEASALDLITVNEASAMAGFTNMSLSLNSTLDSIFLDPDDSKIKGRFLGGSVSLTFEDGIGTMYELSGPVIGMEVEVDSHGAGFTALSAQGLFEAVTASLPANATGTWPQASPLWSSMKGIIFNIGEDLGADFGWDRDWTGDAESQWEFTPDASASPEPTSMLLIALGGLAVLRRR